MKKKLDKTDYILWGVIVVYTGVIYATLSLVSKAQKFLAEKYGPNVFEHIYWIFAIIGVMFIIYIFRTFRGKDLPGKLIAFALFAALYTYYLSGMKYSVEKIHFLEYGLLGALVFIAATRHSAPWAAILASLNIVFWLGMGDEAIQWALPSRVGEIRDSIINLFSGALGIGLVWFTTDRHYQNTVTVVQMKVVLGSLAGTTVLTALFLTYIHGFGGVIETKDPGKIFSAFTARELRQINTPDNSVPAAKRNIYENEAVRHLFQREYFFTNEYKTKTGVVYKLYGHSFFENRVLEVYYSRYLKENAGKRSGPLLQHIDREVAAKVMNRPVVWPDSLRQSLEQTLPDSNRIMKSRVKSTLIVSFEKRDLLVYCALILLVLGYVWFLIGKTEQHQ